MKDALKKVEDQVVILLSFCVVIVNLIKVAIVAGFHLFPFRTEKLSPFTPMVLRKWESRSLPFLKEAFQFLKAEMLLFFITASFCFHCSFLFLWKQLI